MPTAARAASHQRQAAPLRDGSIQNTGPNAATRINDNEPVQSPPPVEYAAECG
jgi:hypothetical protein